MDASTSKKRILILGGGFGGIYTARHLEGLFKRRSDVEIVLVSRDNFLLMTPYQNGSVWPHDNGIIAMGFKRYGFAKEAAMVARDISAAASYTRHGLNWHNCLSARSSINYRWFSGWVSTMSNRHATLFLLRGRPPGHRP
jgi:hypothetical protein